MTDTVPIANEINRLIAAGMREHEILLLIARRLRFPELMPAELSTAMQVAMADVERRMITGQRMKRCL
jgi:hypothetical protein